MKITRLCGVRLRLVSCIELLCKLSGFQKVCNYSSCNYHYPTLCYHSTYSAVEVHVDYLHYLVVSHHQPETVGIIWILQTTRKQ